MKPLFSILHSTARPEKWRAAYDEWIGKAAHPESVEYVLCIDERWGFGRSGGIKPGVLRDQDKLVFNEGPQTAVSGWNTAGAASTGSILLVAADDFFPCERWDEALCSVLDNGACKYFPYRHPEANFAIRVSTASPFDKRGHMTHAFMSRTRYEHQGNTVYCPEYRGVFCDDDFTAHAEQDGVIIEARHLVFPHRHPLYENRPEALDAAFWHHNKPEDYAFGRAVFERRQEACFGHPELVEKRKLAESAGGQESLAADDKPVESRSIALCLPGETFDASWVAAMFRLNAHLANRGFNVAIQMAHTTNVYVTRADLLEAVTAQQPEPDYVLWIDDDNYLEPAQFEQLLAGLEANPEADGIAGWCWIQDQGRGKMYPSCGVFSADGLRLEPFDGQQFPQSQKLRNIDWTGFPSFLWRRRLIEKAGPRPFLPLLGEGFRYGLSGEDHAFCRRAKDGGAVLLVDPRVRVPHLKFRAIEPAWVVEAPKKEPVIVGMIRAKDSASLIGRAVRSLWQVCKHVLVFDDHSSDGTRAAATEAGALAFMSEFDGDGPDESRDKNWMAAKARELWPDLDWLFCIDADEELEPGCGEKVMGAVRANGVACFALPFFHLWDRPDQIRVDGWYSKFVRRSLYRPLEGSRFESLYAKMGAQVHTGLHVGNAPGGAEANYHVLNVRLIHHGYMDRATRLRKYEYYNRLDPANDLEDRYRHTVQGDIPEVPADAKLKYAGPLELAPLPRDLFERLGLSEFYEVHAM